MIHRICRVILALCAAFGCVGNSLPAADDTWKIGLAVADITPVEPVLLSGYGSRDEPFESIDCPLYAKCMAIEDGEGNLAVLITVDTESMYPHTAAPFCERIMERTGLKREQILVNFSHSHASPYLTLDLETKAYGATPETAKKTVANTRRLFEQAASAVEKALADRQPARLSFGVGVAPFVMNRRAFAKGGVRIGVNPSGYVDRSVPVLRVDDLDGNPRAVVFGCACHNTTIGGDSFVVCGDYAGYAQQQIEADHPGVQAMFMIGCGADANPYPRGTIELAKEHGRELGQTVDRFLSTETATDGRGRTDRRTGEVAMAPVAGPLAVAFEQVELPLRRVPSVEAMREEAQGSDRWQAYHARLMLDLVEQGKEVPTHYRCPLAVWQFGSDLTMVGFSGEVVAGYVPLVEKALGHRGLWVAAYCNVMYGYVPTVQVIEEGGYEVRGLENGEVGQFAPEAEETLMQRVVALAKQVRDQAEGSD